MGEAIPFQSHPSDYIKDNIHLLLVCPLCPLNIC